MFEVTMRRLQIQCSCSSLGSSRTQFSLLDGQRGRLKENKFGDEDVFEVPMRRWLSWLLSAQAFIPHLQTMQTCSFERPFAL